MVLLKVMYGQPIPIAPGAGHKLIATVVYMEETLYLHKMFPWKSPFLLMDFKGS